MTDPLELAFSDYLDGNINNEIIIHSNKADTESVAVSYFFRNYNEMPLLEQKALALCSGEILDIGAGSGSHTLFLQQSGKNVSALEIRPGLVEVMNKRGVINLINSDIYKFKAKRFDTLLMLMNGIGFTENFFGLRKFFKHAKDILKPGGQFILDSSDLLYLYEEEDGSVLIDLNEEYYGELEYIFEYNGVKGDPFKWLFVDFTNLSFLAQEEGFDCEMVYEDDHFNYLAVLRLLT